LLSFVCLPPPPPTSTLFPYTTLFRSLLSLYKRPHRGDERSRPTRHRPHLRQHDFRVAAGHDVGAVPPQLLVQLLAGPEPDLDDLDRKSTRLNSSHVSISYAVFCLKKK